MRIYDGSIVTVSGIDFMVSIEFDQLMGPPWDKEDGHGPVSDWTTDKKRSYELLLCADGYFHRFYDFQEAVKIARRDGWNTAPYVWKTAGEQAHAAALADFRWLKRWCDGKWQYVIITVHPLDDFGDILPMSASLGGVEYNPDDTSCISYIVEDLAHEVISEHEYMFAAPLPRVEAVINPDDLLTLPDFATPTRAA